MDWDAFVSIATAMGVSLAAWQLWENKKLTAAAFEDHFDEQYRNLSYIIPVDALIGQNPSKEVSYQAREAVYNYLDLCNEQVYQRQKNRISKDRWREWNTGIRQNLERSFFAEVWSEVKDSTPKHFSYLERLESENFTSDPADW